MTYEWTVDDTLCGDDEQRIKQTIQSHLDDLTGYEERLDGFDADDLKAFLQRYESLQNELNKLSAYYSLRFAENTGDTEVMAKQKQLSQLAADTSNDLLFFFDWFKHLDNDQAQAYIEADSLSNYAYYLEKLRKAADHTRSKEVEEALTIKDVAYSNLSDLYDTITNDFTYEFNGDELTRDELKTYVKSTDPAEREEAYETMLGTFRDNATVLSELYTTIANDWRNEAKQIRGYEDSISVRTKGQDIDKEAVTTLMQTVRDNRDIFHDYFDVKHDILTGLGQDYDHNRYHIYAPLKTSESQYDFDDAKDLVLDTFRDFDERFADAAQTVFDDDHIHSHPEQGKRSGAFCMDGPTGVTPYVLLNYDNTLNDVSTMAHELGHAVHDVFTDDQTVLNRHPVTPMAETASVFAEMLLTDRLLNETDNAEDKVALLGHFLDDQYATILRQAYFVEFERRAHEALGEGASKDDLDDIYDDLVDEQFGDLTVPDVFTHEWNYIPHIHHSPFYCYSYAWGNLLVLSLYDVYQEQGDAFVDDYIDLLRAGKSESPADLLDRFGFDPTQQSFWERGFDIIRSRLDDLNDAKQRLDER